MNQSTAIDQSDVLQVGDQWDKAVITCDIQMNQSTAIDQSDVLQVGDTNNDPPPPPPPPPQTHTHTHMHKKKAQNKNFVASTVCVTFALFSLI